ncbi:MAG: cation:dicarboxylase symporter family transporter [Pseudomonadota bacterium]
MSAESSYSARLPAWVLLSAVLGIAAGALLGDSASLLQPIGTGYVLMMEIVVFPYIICTLLHGLGSLTTNTAMRLFKSSWLIYVGVWGITFFIIFLLSFAIPPAPPPSFIDANTPTKGLNLLEILIPSNPFVDLVQNHVPAVVVFSITFGIAIQRASNKEAFLSVLDVMRTASVTIWNWIVLLAPLGVFALFANTVGTLEPDKLLDLSLYILTVLCGTLILAFWVLPSLIAALCPLTTREVVRELQSALVIAVVTTLSVAALPFVQRAVEKLATQLEIEDKDRSEVLQTTLAVSYPLGQLGNYFIWLFILFAAFYYRVPINLTDQIALPIVVLLSGIGSPSSSIDAVAFLASWLDLPSASTNLYVELMTVTRYGQVVASVMGFAFICILVTLNFYGKLNFRPKKMAQSVVVSCVVLVAVTVIGRNIQIHRPYNPAAPYMSFTLPADLTQDLKVTMGELDGTPPAKASEGEEKLSRLDRIRSSGELRVGFNANVIPFSYRNANNELVGFDIAYAYQLAKDLNVNLRLVPFQWQELVDDLGKDRFDLAASGIYVTEKRLRELDVSAPYYRSPLALIVHADEAEKFLSRSSIEAQENLKVAVFDDPVLLPIAKGLFKGADLTVLSNYSNLAEKPNIDAAIWTLEQARAWAATRQDYTAVVPGDLGGELLIAYLLPKGAPELRQFLNYWLQLQQVNGFHDRMVALWLEGKPDEPAKKEQSSFMGHLLGWEKDTPQM